MTIQNGNYAAKIRTNDGAFIVSIVYANEWMQTNCWSGEVMEARTYKTEKAAVKGAEKLLASYAPSR
jgi:hypothetical protein